MGTDLGGSLLHMHFALGHTQPREFRNCSQNFSPALRDYFKPHDCEIQILFFTLLALQTVRFSGRYYWFDWKRGKVQ